jgi:hypothetical protein
MLFTPENAVYHLLVSNPGVASLVGFQVYPVAVPKGAGFPFVVYRRANIARQHALNGPILMPEVNLQIASWTESHDDARELADQIRLALNGYIGTVAGCTIHDMRLVSETDDYLDPAAVGAQLPPAYETRQLYQIRWTESAF